MEGRRDDGSGTKHIHTPSHSVQGCGFSVVETMLNSIDSGDEMEVSDQLKDEVLLDNDDLKRTNRLHFTNIVEELIDARTLLDAMKSLQARLVEKLQHVRQENDRLVETLNNSNKAQALPILDHESHGSENGGLQNQNLPSTTQTKA